MPNPTLPPIFDFRTTRLKVTHWGETLADPIARATLLLNLPGLLTDEVTRDLPPSYVLTEDAAAWVAARQHESDVYLISEQDQLVGLLILFVDTQSAAIHIGYLFAQSAWGQGYATELLLGLIAAAPPPTTFLAGVATTNPASAHVLRKAGFRLEAEQKEQGMLTFSRKVEA
ncbi:GNAT family N-acetyltransferase [Yoonia sp. I 8.24]|uniref:GNAT family N-acetyltransferase n=1 Tax=Yoonia sp. I 8.24 TaxID=1537229 RepID=UPI001EDF2903|nr:GNAT family N-acetyltransferase [Yoonia sp. I 8.24]MCG3267512.1 GNAT family N-acetyltransferase [Yoonia sp. I 8.24]